MSKSLPPISEKPSGIFSSIFSTVSRPVIWLTHKIHQLVRGKTLEDEVAKVDSQAQKVLEEGDRQEALQLYSKAWAQKEKKPQPKGISPRKRVDLGTQVYNSITKIREKIEQAKQLPKGSIEEFNALLSEFEAFNAELAGHLKNMYDIDIPSSENFKSALAELKDLKDKAPASAKSVVSTLEQRLKQGLNAYYEKKIGDAEDTYAEMWNKFSWKIKEGEGRLKDPTFNRTHWLRELREDDRKFSYAMNEFKLTLSIVEKDCPEELGKTARLVSERKAMNRDEENRKAIAHKLWNENKRKGEVRVPPDDILKAVEQIVASSPEEIKASLNKQIEDVDKFCEGLKRGKSLENRFYDPNSLTQILEGKGTTEQLRMRLEVAYDEYKACVASPDPLCEEAEKSLLKLAVPKLRELTGGKSAQEILEREWRVAKPGRLQRLITTLFKRRSR